MRDPDHRRPEIDGRLYVVPVRVAPCEVPLVLGAYQWVDVGQFEHAVQELHRRFVAPLVQTLELTGGRSGP